MKDHKDNPKEIRVKINLGCKMTILNEYRTPRPNTSEWYEYFPKGWHKKIHKFKKK